MANLPGFGIVSEISIQLCDLLPIDDLCHLDVQKSRLTFRHFLEIALKTCEMHYLSANYHFPFI